MKLSWGTKAYTQFRASKKGPAEWLATNAELWEQLLPVKETRALMAHPSDGQWVDMAEEIQKVVGSGMLGERLFGFALESIMSELVEKAIDKEVQALLLYKTITGDDYMKHIKQAKHEIDSIKSIEVLPDRRPIIVRYRQWPLNLKVNCVADEINYRMAAALRGLAVESGDLVPMVSEEIPTQINKKQH